MARGTPGLLESLVDPECLNPCNHHGRAFISMQWKSVRIHAFPIEYPRFIPPLLGLPVHLGGRIVMNFKFTRFPNNLLPFDTVSICFFQHAFDVIKPFS